MLKAISKVMAVTLLSGLSAGCAGERPINLGAHNGTFIPCPPTPNCVSSQAADQRHHIKPLVFTGAPDTAFSQLQQILADRGDTTAIEHGTGYLGVEFHTTFFVDDGEFLLDPGNSIIHVRSASRLGYSDFGKNRSRMEEIREELKRRLPPIEEP
ncbi:MAG: DUF1499 domain-containing protein [Desulfuromonadales bacterium]|nr:DUF1499 domain-containing protein [Desulfuromonadales bacterium]